jgi:hypothetical protein
MMMIKNSIIIIITIIISYSTESVNSYSIISYNNNNNKINKNLNTIKLPAIYWNSRNILFKKNDYLKINARLGDNIDLLCSKISNDASSEQNEYSMIYKVATKYEFDNCLVNTKNVNTIPILKCDKTTTSQRSAVKYTIYFVKYSPVPYALEFEENKEYYFLSTSSGTKNGLNDKSGGLCANNNMKFSIKILPDEQDDGMADNPADYQTNSNDFLSIITGVINNRLNKNDQQRSTTSTNSNQPTHMSYMLSKASVSFNKNSILFYFCFFILLSILTENLIFFL